MGVSEFIAGLVSISVIIGTFIGLAAIRPLKLYHKWKVVKFIYDDGTFDYTLLRNGFLAMPFLYYPDKVTEEDGHPGTFHAIGMGEDKVMEVLDSRYEKYKKLYGRKKVVEKYVIGTK